MVNDNHTCKVCGEPYHYCSSCGVYVEHELGCCSERCMEIDLGEYDAVAVFMGSLDKDQLKDLKYIFDDGQLINALMFKVVNHELD